MAQKHLSEDEIRYTVTAETQKAQKEIHQLQQKTKDLSKAEKERRSRMIELEAQGKKNSQEWRNLRKSVDDYHKKIKENDRQIAELTKKLGVSGMTMNQLKKHAKELQRELDNTSKAANPEDYEQLERRLKVVTERMDELKRGARGVMDVLQSDETINFMAGSFMVKFSEWIGHGIRKIHDFIEESTDMAESVDGISHAFDQLDKPDLLQNLRKATKGTVNDMLLMKAAVQAKDFRIPLEDLGKYLQFAQLKAQQTGQSVDYMTNSIITGLGRKSPMILDNLGISAAEIGEKTKETGDFMLAVASIVENQLAQAGETYVSATDRATQRTVKLQNKQLELGKALLPLKEMWVDAYGTAIVSIMDVIKWMITHKQTTLLLTVAIAGFTVSMVALNAQLKEYIVTSKAAMVLNAGWKTAMTTMKGLAILAKAAFFALSGNISRASAALRVFNTACKANIYLLVATAVAAAAVALYNYYKKSTELTEVQKQLIATQERLAKAIRNTNLTLLRDIKDVEEQVSKSTAKEITQIETLRKTVENNNKSYDERKNALEALKRIVPSYHADLTTEGKLINNNTSALSDYITQLRKAAMQQAIFSKMTEITENTLNHQLQLQQRQGNRQYAVNQAKKYGVNLDTSEVSKRWGTKYDQGVGRQVIVYEVVDKATGEVREITKDLYNNVKKYQELVQYNDARILEEKNLIQRNEKRQKNIETLASKNGVTTTGDAAISSQPGTVGEEIEKLKAEIESLNAERLTIKTGDTKGLEVIDRKLAALQQKKAQLEGSTVTSVTTTAGNNNIDQQNREADNFAVSSLTSARTSDINAENARYQQEINALKKALVEKSITQEQYNVKEQTEKVNHAGKLLDIETLYLDQAQQLQIHDANKQQQLVTQQNRNLEQAQQQSFDAQLEAQRTFQSLMEKLQKSATEGGKKDPVEQLKVEKEAQEKVLQGYYQASLEYAEKNGLDAQAVEVAYLSAKENLDIQYAEKRKDLELKTQQDLLQIRQQYGLASQQELYQQQLLMLDQHLAEGKLKEEDYEKAKLNLKRDYYKQQFDYYSKLVSDAVSALQDAEIANINAKYDAEIEAAKGNEEEVERLENEKAQKTLDIQKKYADVNFAIKASQIIADTAVSIMKATAELGPIAGAVAAALLSVTGAAQLAAANAERQKVKKMTLNNAGGTASKSGARVATGLESGGSLNVIREQDGKEFRDVDYDPDRRGFIDHPTVIVGEGPVGRSKEFVASNAAVNNPTIAPALAAIDNAQRTGTIRTLDLRKVMQLPAFSGRENGGFISSTSPTVGGSTVPSPMPTEEKELLQKLLMFLQSLIDNGVDAFVVLSEFERQQKLLEKSRNIGSK